MPTNLNQYNYILPTFLFSDNFCLPALRYSVVFKYIYQACYNPLHIAHRLNASEVIN